MIIRNLETFVDSKSLVNEVSVGSTKVVGGHTAHHIHIQTQGTYVIDRWWLRAAYEPWTDMAAKLTLSSPVAFKTSLLPKSSSLSPLSCTLSCPKTNVVGVKVQAKLGKMKSPASPFLKVYILLCDYFIYLSFWCNEWGWDDNVKHVALVLLGGGDDEIKKGGKKKFITRDEEPQQ